MKKNQFFFIPSCLLLVLGITILKSLPVRAIDPIIIDKSIQGPPQGTGQDQDYHSNDILHDTNVIDCPGTVPVSQTFQPQAASGTPVPYDVNQISAPVSGYSDPNKPWNSSYEHQGIDHTNNNITNPLSADSRARALTSFKGTNPDGNYGMNDRLSPYAVARCQKAQRLIYALQSLGQDPSVDLSYQNSQIGWLCFGIYYTLKEKPNTANCNAIRLSDIAASLASDSIFYPTTVNCYSLPDPTTLTGVVALPTDFQPHLLNHDDADTLLNTIDAIDPGSMASAVQICDSNGCQTPKERQIPGGNWMASYQNTLLVHNETPKNYSLCQSTAQTPSVDTTNPVIGLVATIKKFFGTITSTAQTFTGTATKVDIFPAGVQNGINRDETFLNNFITAKDQAGNQTADQKGSSTDGNTLDPGNPAARRTFSQQILPQNF